MEIHRHPSSKHVAANHQREWVFGLFWCGLCLFVLAFFAPTENSAVRELVLVYFQPMLPITFALWLWGHNVQRFHDLSIDYEACFSSKDRKTLLPAAEVYRVALVVTAICLTFATAFAVVGAVGWYALADFLPLCMYFMMALLLVAPVDYLNMPSRLFFGETLQRVLVPIQDVSWSDFLLADIMTSLSKSTGDLSKAWSALLAGPALTSLANTSTTSAAENGTEVRVVDPLGLPVLIALCLPYIIRFIQCLIVYRTTGNRSQLLNALKYATAFPALVLTAIEHEYHILGRRYPLYDAWLVAMFVNSLYSYYWDLEMDWDMPWLVQPGGRTVLGILRLPGLKIDAFYRPSWYVWAALSNLALRLAWTHRLMGNLESHNAVALTIAMLEVFRRYQWTYVRVETELRKIKLKQTHDHDVDADEQKHHMMEAQHEDGA
ncbi:hypothetical protein HYH03_013811 [Edaphochlamys debaryana]|uniref:EXS domain-containing protein n=1 Tax=Edaphochlamys debaryana TaxID=47281 RepID=A0A835XP89_9CHLO|nr:hypothetical protein HYH03_013811 [Edaphochlamys debaryana]|eukprot:KAG2487531.1 hypothetical protein HYH03_013811 [Edaphochlamys debaryana]